jgi:hypothetical protein
VQNKTTSVQTRGEFVFDYVIILLQIIRNLGLLFFLVIKVSRILIQKAGNFLTMEIRNNFSAANPR